ncbi:MAG: hypothetical protein IJV51_05760 [Oscillospiraceae bacterium]|nr:hypothetical protein [Oscillospiraceae bacterium]
MGRTERAFYHALAALLFAAACAWSLAALYRRMDAPEPPAPTPAPSAAPAALRFRGLLIRQEQRLPAGAFPDAAPGARLSAADTGTESALYFPACDGWEELKPEDAERLTPAGLERLLDAEPPETGDAARLVYGFSLLCAALTEGDVSPLPGPCRLTIDGAQGELAGDILSVTADALGRRMLVIRLTDFPEKLYELRTVEGKVESEKWKGK